MADATKLLIGGHGIVYVLLFGVTSVVAQIFLDYKRYVSVLKWLTLSLFAYVAALAFAKVSWGEALAGILVPRLTWSADYFTTIVAILGTTISPYLFFWQASQEAEDQRVDATKRPLDRKALWRAEGIPSHPRRHHHRHGVLQSDRAVDHRHRGGDAACGRQDRHPDLGAGGRSAASDRRRIRRSDFCARHRRHRVAGDPGARRRDRVRRRRGAAMAGRARAQAEGGRRLLCRAGVVGRQSASR